MAGVKEIVRRGASPEQIKFCKAFLEEGSIANRGEFDGDYYQQLFGLMAQVVVGDLLGCERPTNDGTFDGGWDLKHKGNLIDVKCSLRNVPFRVGSFVHNFLGSQMRYEADSFIFVSYDKQAGLFEICGFITKADLKEKAKFYKYGSMRPRDDGTEMEVRAVSGNWEIKNKSLTPFIDVL